MSDTLQENSNGQISPGSADEPQRILVVDDTKDARRLLTMRLEREGYTVLAASRGTEAIELVKEFGLPHLAILDILMPGMDGLDLASHLRRMGDLPIIFVSALSDPEVKTDAINRYAEDYITKPFHFGELMARIRRILMRTTSEPPVSPEEMIDERLRINFAQQYVIADNQRISLTPIENRIMHVLFSHRGRTIAPETLLAKVWSPHQKGTVESLWVHVRRLRDKIEPDPDKPHYIVTMRGQGYCLLGPDHLVATPTPDTDQVTTASP
jgi:DNA-binding response OmpR family regulator